MSGRWATKPLDLLRALRKRVQDASHAADAIGMVEFDLADGSFQVGIRHQLARCEEPGVVVQILELRNPVVIGLACWPVRMEYSTALADGEVGKRAIELMLDDPLL